MEYSGKRHYEPSEDMSHEQLSNNEKNRQNNKYNKKKTYPPSSYLTTMGTTTDEILNNHVSILLKNIYVMCFRKPWVRVK